MDFRWLASFVTLFLCLGHSTFSFLGTLAVPDARQDRDSPATDVDGDPLAFFGFGDSYADTGNREATADSWKVPYGVTWPGTPAGRWCNGELQTDKLAAALGLPSPTPYISIGKNPSKSPRSGINFALGSTGVLETTAYGLATFGQQIDNFNSTIAKGFYTPTTLASSVALVSISGNDYGVWDGQDAQTFIENIVNLIRQGLVRLTDLGVGNVIVANLPPFDCAPTSTWTENYTQCTNLFWGVVDYHNLLLANAIEELNGQGETTLLLLDQYASFTDTLNEFTYPLRPCCKGIDDSGSTFCSSVASNGDTAYTLCEDPSIHFFFDTVHPSQDGWQKVVNRYLQEPGYLVHHRNLTLLEYWIRSEIVNPGRELGMV